MSRWRKQSAKEMEAYGYTVDKTCYPWVAYKGPRFQPTEMHLIATDDEVEGRKRRQAISRAQAAQPRIVDESERTAVVVCSQRSYVVPKDVADEIEELKRQLKNSEDDGARARMALEELELVAS